VAYRTISAYKTPIGAQRLFGFGTKVGKNDRKGDRTKVRPPFLMVSPAG
jgi:hypothetical protein